MFPRNENRNEGIFAKATLLRNRPFISRWYTPSPEKTLLGVGGILKRGGGGVYNSCRGGLQDKHPPASPERCLLAKKRGGGGGVYDFSMEGSQPGRLWRRSEIVMEANLQKNSTNKFYYKIWGFSVCRAAKTKPFARTCFARIFSTDFCANFCTDSLRDFFLRGFLHGIFARILLHRLLHGFFARMFAWIFARICCTNFGTDFCTDFLHGFLGCPREAPKFHWENPLENSPCFGGLGGRRVRNLTKRVSEDWGGVGRRQWGSSHSSGLNQYS